MMSGTPENPKAAVKANSRKHNREDLKKMMCKSVFMVRMVKHRLQYFGGNKLVEPRERSADSRRIRSEDIGSVLRITEVEKPYVGLEGLSDEELDD